MFKATISKKELLLDPLSSISELIEEGLFKVTASGISLLAADRAMVAVVDFNLSSSAFDSYESDADQTIGLNIDNMLSILKRASGKDKIAFHLDGKAFKVEIIGASKRKFTVPLVEIAQEEIPQIDQLSDFTANAEVKSDVLLSGIGDAEIVADSILFNTLPDKFIMRAEGDISRTELELEKGNESLLSLTSGPDIKSRYPIDYLKKMLKASGISDSVSLQFGQDYPMKISFKSGDQASLRFVLAPRVNEE